MVYPDHDPQRFHQAEEFLRNLGVEYANWSRRILTAECLRRDLEISLGDTSDIIVITDGKKRITWHGGVTSFNTSLARNLSQQKDAMSKFMRANDVQFAENAAFRSADEEAAWGWAQPLLPVVIKPPDGKQGKNVHVEINSREEFSKAFNLVAQDSPSVLVEEQFYGAEYRCLLINGKLIGTTRRRPASVKGDGVSTIEDLVMHKNFNRGPIHQELLLDEEARGELTRQGFTPESTPAPEERVYLRAISNLHTGGDAIEAADELTTAQVQRVEEAGKKVPGLRFCGFDVVVPQGESEDVRFIEANDGPMLSMHHFPWEGKPRDVAQALITAMFPRVPPRAGQ